MEPQRCPECAAIYLEGKCCQDQFHQMLFWENEFGELGVVHHLMVLCFHLQHPGLLSPEGLAGMISLLIDFIYHNLNPEEVRRRNRSKLSSTERGWKIKATAVRRATYAQPIAWSVTAQDVTAAGSSNYLESVRGWANSILSDLQASGNI